MATPKIIHQDLDDFLCEIQCEEVYDEELDFVARQIAADCEDEWQQSHTMSTRENWA